MAPALTSSLSAEPGSLRRCRWLAALASLRQQLAESKCKQSLCSTARPRDSEKARQRNWRNQIGATEKVTRVFKRERNATPSLPSVMASSIVTLPPRGKTKPQRVQPRRSTGKSDPGNQYREHRRKKERMCKSPMPPEITVSDSEAESDHIHVWQHRADRTNCPNPLRNLRTSEERANPEGCHRV